MNDGLVTLPSPVTAQETLSRLLSAIADRGLAVFATIDHAYAARQAGLEMRPASLVLFGSPKAGTPLMQIAPTLAIDLPLKALVWEDDEGNAWLTYNAPSWVARRHSLSIEDVAEESWESEGGAVDTDPRHLGLAAPIELDRAAGPLITGMAVALAEIARSVLRTNPAR